MSDRHDSGDERGVRALRENGGETASETYNLVAQSTPMVGAFYGGMTGIAWKQETHSGGYTRPAKKYYCKEVLISA